MARAKTPAERKVVSFRIEKQLAMTFELLLQDPVSNRGSYGKKGYVIEELLKRLLDAARKDTKSIRVDDLTKLMR